MLRLRMCPARRPWRSIGLLVVLVVLAAALGATASAQVATLGSPAPEASEAPASPAPDGQQGLLDWAACMREQGIDMPDPNADGSYVDYDWKLDLKGEEYTAADEVCRELTGDGGK